MIGDVFADYNDRWIVPDDRQLALRGRLGTGWSTIHVNNFNQHAPSISDDEQELIVTVLRRNEYIQIQEQYRIGRLVKKLEHMKRNIYGDGAITCLICGARTRLFKNVLHFCGKCGKIVCTKCSMELRPPRDGYGKLYICVLCNEDIMLWKRSGAWFYKSIPKYIILGNNNIPVTDAVPESLLNDSYVVLRQSRDSIADGSDDSDNIERTSSKAFEIHEDIKYVGHARINTDEDSRSIKSANFNTRRCSIDTVSSGDSSEAIDTEEKQDKLDSSQQSINSSVGNEAEKENDANSMSDSETTTSIVGKTKALFRKVSREVFPESRPNNSQSAKQAETIDEVISRSNSETSLDSYQDIDAIFYSYEVGVEMPAEDKEYTGQRGMIKFTLQYDTGTQDLTAVIDSCKGLKSSEKETILNPYVKILILPVLPEAAKASKKRTPTMKKTNDPVYNFCVVYPGVSNSDIERKGVRLSVMDETSFGHHPTIGETCVPLKGLSTHPIQQFRRILDARANDDTLFLDSKKEEPIPGRIELALQYSSEKQQLIVGVIRCVGLKALDPNGYSDPFVKCYLLPDPNKKTKRKTGIKKRTLNPEFNEEFQYDISLEELAKRTLCLSVWDYDVGRTNDYIGGLTLGIESSGEALKHWFETLKTADRRVIRWHSLLETCPMLNE